MAHWAVPHDVAGFGVFVGLVGIACAAYVQMVFDPPVPARYPSALALAGAGLVAMNASTVTALTQGMLLALRQVTVLVAFVLFVGGTARVLVEASDAAWDSRSGNGLDRGYSGGHGRGRGSRSARDRGRGRGRDRAEDARAAPAAAPDRKRRLSGPADTPDKTMTAAELELVVDHYLDKARRWIR